MRADRLISILLILKRSKKMTAGELAAQFEVSERTIYRDVIAMSTAGIPIYTEKGPGGGISILDDYQADLVNMTEDEIQALGLLSIPEEFERLGLGDHLRSALQKLNVVQSAIQGQGRKSIYFDPLGWQSSGMGQGVFETIMEAIQLQKKCWVRYRFIREMVNESVVDILGIVSKQFNWYVVWKMDEKISVRELSSLIDAQGLNEAAEIPHDFQLQAYWESWCQKSMHDRGSFVVQLKVARQALLLFNQVFSSQSSLNSEEFYDETVPEWMETQLRFPSLEEARYRLLGMGSAVQVLAPEVLQLSMRDFAAQICHIYSTN